jgi:hypothetical protein
MSNDCRDWREDNGALSLDKYLSKQCLSALISLQGVPKVIPEVQVPVTKE